MADELKPCPFCGGPVKLEKAHQQRHAHLGMRQFWGVVCRNIANVGGTCCIEQVPSASPEAAIERWNRRAAPSFPVADDGYRAAAQTSVESAETRIDTGSKPLFASIDSDPEFQRLAEYWRGEPYGTRSFLNAWDELVAYVDSRAQQGAAQAQAGEARDAARYRWLRDSCPDLEGMTSAWLYDDFDKDIDAAMAAPATSRGSNG